MEFSVYYIDDTKLDHYYTQVSRLSDKKTYPLPDNQPLQELLQGLINFTRAPHKVYTYASSRLFILLLLLLLFRCQMPVWSSRPRTTTATWIWSTH